ncbi:MAG: alpha/beta hydrolase [Candidatus Zapsychrus exili]|nr:alpha/beta hydrolase [Candidatus Zapsychrus exili]
MFKPVDVLSIKSASNPILDYEQSISAINKKIDHEKGVVADHGFTRVLTHGKKTEHTIVLYHGFTNCPRQYEQLEQRFFEKGYNVYVPRYPYHGLADRYTKEIRKLTLKDIIDVCDSSVDIARGLGEKVSVLGLSLGGVMAAFSSQFRDDIEKSFVLVPSFAWYFLPGVIRPIVNLCYLLPNMFLWWDPVKKDKRQCPYSMYHHFSSRQMGHIMRLGLSVLYAAKKQAPKSKDIVVMTDETDIAVDEKATQKLIKDWRRHGACVQFYCFGKELGIEHDIIDPLHPYAKVETVYDKILEYI